jgi:quinol monooxygenase YgiN
VIAIAGSIDLVDASQRDELVERSLALQVSTRADEPGCLAYVFTADPAVPHRIHVFELWADEAALTAHFAHPNFGAMREVLRSYERGPSSIRKYRIDRDAPVYDDSGQATATFPADDADVAGDEP